LGNRTINDWVAITKNEKSGWSQFYRELLAQPLSDIPKFQKAVSDFGHSIMFESILAASTKKLTGDPLNYVLGIAIAKASEAARDTTEDDRYRMRLERNKARVISQNEELENKIEKARKLSGTN
jgi:hypothetical protein